MLIFPDPAKFERMPEGAFGKDEIAPDRRKTDRHIASYRPCCIWASGRFHLAIIRDYSTHGAKVEIDVDLEVGDEIFYFCDQRRSIRALVVWKGDGCVGIENLEIKKLCSSTHPSRSVRVPFEAQARVWHRQSMKLVSICNISMGGMAVKGLEGVKRGELLSVESCGLTFVNASVRWCEDDLVGLRFSDKVRKERLAFILNEFQQPARAA
jgi:hypothetical protein